MAGGHWQPIETAPRDGTPVIITNWPTFKDDPEGLNMAHPVAARWTHGRWVFLEYPMEDGLHVFHVPEPHSWMPLPELPERK